VSVWPERLSGGSGQSGCHGPRYWWQGQPLPERFIDLYVEALTAADEGCMQVLREGAEYIGKAIGYAVNLLDPEMIFVAGGTRPNWS